MTDDTFTLPPNNLEKVRGFHPLPGCPVIPNHGKLVAVFYGICQPSEPLT